MGKLRLKVSLAVPRCRLVFGFERLEVDEDALTKDLFDQFHHKTGFPQETLCAVYFGKDMKPELPLSSYEMLDNSEVHIMPLKYDDFKWDGIVEEHPFLRYLERKPKFGREHQIYKWFHSLAVDKQKEAGVSVAGSSEVEGAGTDSAPSYTS